MPPEEVGEPGRAGLGMGEAGDRVDDHGSPSSAPKIAGLAGDLDDLGGAGEPEVVDRDGLEDPQLNAAVARPSEVDDRQETTANDESSTCRSEAIVTGGRQVAIAEYHIYDF
jgi:hypothetical protein